MISTAGNLKLHIFGKIIDVNGDQKQLVGLKTIGHNAGDILHILDRYYAVDDNLELEPIDSEDIGDFEISFNVTKNIVDFRYTFSDVLKSWDSYATIHRISIRPDDAFIIEQFGKAFDPDVKITYINGGDNYIIISKKLRTISAKSPPKLNWFNDVWVSIRLNTTYDFEDRYNFRYTNLRLCESKNAELYGTLSPYEYVHSKFNPTDYNYISQAERNGYGYNNWFETPTRYYLICNQNLKIH